MRVGELVNALSVCGPGEDVTICIGTKDGFTEFYHTESISGGGPEHRPIMLNGSYKEMDSNR